MSFYRVCVNEFHSIAMCFDSGVVAKALSYGLSGYQFCDLRSNTKKLVLDIARKVVVDSSCEPCFYIKLIRAILNADQPVWVDGAYVAETEYGSGFAFVIKVFIAKGAAVLHFPFALAFYKVFSRTGSTWLTN